MNQAASKISSRSMYSLASCPSKTRLVAFAMASFMSTVAAVVAATRKYFGFTAPFAVVLSANAAYSAAIFGAAALFFGALTLSGLYCLRQKALDKIKSNFFTIDGPIDGDESDGSDSSVISSKSSTSDSLKEGGSMCSLSRCSLPRCYSTGSLKLSDFDDSPVRSLGRPLSLYDLEVKYDPGLTEAVESSESRLQAIKSDTLPLVSLSILPFDGRANGRYVDVKLTF